MSPVCSTNCGLTGRLRIFATASRKVATGSGLAAFLKPIWLSLICTKVKGAEAVVASPASALDATPPPIVQTTPAPDQAMHFRRPRRSGQSGEACASASVRTVFMTGRLLGLAGSGMETAIAAGLFPTSAEKVQSPDGDPETLRSKPRAGRDRNAPQRSITAARLSLRPD